MATRKKTVQSGWETVEPEGVAVGDVVRFHVSSSTPLDDGADVIFGHGTVTALAGDGRVQVSYRWHVTGGAEWQHSFLVEPALLVGIYRRSEVSA